MQRPSTSIQMQRPSSSAIERSSKPVSGAKAVSAVVIAAAAWMISGSRTAAAFAPRSSPIAAATPRARARHGRALHAESEGRLSVAIVGGGVAGLSCASRLLSASSPGGGGDHYSPGVLGGELAVDVTVFDTGRLRPGGRCSSRLPGDKPPSPPAPQRQKGGKGKGKPKSGDGAGGPDKNGMTENAAPKAGTKGGIGGNMFASGGGFSCVVDHTAQIVSVPSTPEFPTGTAGDESAFQKQLNQWQAERVVKKFHKGSVCELLSSDESNENSDPLLKSLEGSMYYGDGGMGSIPRAMLEHCRSFNNRSKGGSTTLPSSFNMRQDVWVSPSSGIKYKGVVEGEGPPRWEIRQNGKSLGVYDRLVIAHNGKCADRIMSKTPARSLHSLLRTNFAPTVPQSGGNRMTLNSIYSLAFTMDAKSEKGPGSALHYALESLGNNSEAFFGDEVYTVLIKNEPNLRLLSSNTKKHNSNSDGDEVWTLLSSPKFGKRYKGPQENLPAELVEEVTTKMLSSLERCLGLENEILARSVSKSKLQLWGAGVPMNTWRSSTLAEKRADGFLYDSAHGVGSCGDWILDPSVAGAWESGRRLAEWIVKSEAEDVSGGDVGLPPNGSFVSSRAASESGIGTILSQVK